MTVKPSTTDGHSATCWPTLTFPNSQIPTLAIALFVGGGVVFDLLGS